jgi:hypothetical protein
MSLGCVKRIQIGKFWSASGCISEEMYPKRTTSMTLAEERGTDAERAKANTQLTL